MDRIEREEDLIELFAVEDIEVFYGQPCGKANTDFYLCGAQSLVEYCTLNGIDSVIFHCSYAEPMRNYIPRIREELERQYKTSVTNNTVGAWKLPYIDETFYAPVLQKILEQMEQELGKNDEMEEADAERQVVKPRSFPADFRIKFAYCFRVSSSASRRTVSSQLSSVSSALFFIAIHIRGLNQHIAVQNIMKNLDQLSSRPICISS